MIENGNDGEDESLRWRIFERHYFMQNNAKVNCVTYHAASNILVAGFSSGLFGLYELPDFNMIHTLRFDIAAQLTTKDADALFLVYHKTTLTL